MSIVERSGTSLETRQKWRSGSAAPQGRERTKELSRSRCIYSYTKLCFNSSEIRDVGLAFSSTLTQARLCLVNIISKQWNYVEIFAFSPMTSHNNTTTAWILSLWQYEPCSYRVSTGLEPQTQTAVQYHEKDTNLLPAPEKMLLPHKQRENQKYEVYKKMLPSKLLFSGGIATQPQTPITSITYT